MRRLKDHVLLRHNRRPMAGFTHDIPGRKALVEVALIGPTNTNGLFQD